MNTAALDEWSVRPVRLDHGVVEGELPMAVDCHCLPCVSARHVMLCACLILAHPEKLKFEFKGLCIC